MYAKKGSNSPVLNSTTHRWHYTFRVNKTGIRKSQVELKWFVLFLSPSVMKMLKIVR